MLLVGGGFALVGVPMILLALRAFAKDRAITRWPRFPGVVTGSRLDSRSGTYKDNSGYNRSYTTYWPVVHYTYTVNGRELEGTKIARVESTTGKEKAEAQLARYPEGREVMVYCDPADASTAYLEVQRSLGGIILLGFGVVLMIPAVVLWTVYLVG